MDTKIRVMHQVLNPIGSGGVSAEYRALSNSRISEKYELIPLILEELHHGVSIRDVLFYYKKIKTEKPDIIHIRGAAVDGLNAVIAAKLAGKAAVLVTVHGMYSDLVFISELKRWASKHIIETLIFDLADGISCVCQNATNREYFNKYRNKMLPFVYNRMPTYDFGRYRECRKTIRENHKIPDDSIVGLYCGRVTKEKGMGDLLEALKKYDKNWPARYYFMMVGDGNFLADLKKEFDRFSNKERIILTGEQHNVVQYLFASDFFIQPSLHENHSIALLEACAAHIPSIATNVGGTTEIISDKIDGLIIEKHNPDELYDAISIMINDSEFREGCKEHLENDSFKRFSNEHVDQQLQQVYAILWERKLGRVER